MSSDAVQPASTMPPEFVRRQHRRKKIEGFLRLFHFMECEGKVMRITKEAVQEEWPGQAGKSPNNR